jgi:hypothetical protein
MRKATKAETIIPGLFSDSFRDPDSAPSTVHSASPLTITAHPFTLQKSDAAPWENEDALACPGFAVRSLPTGSAEGFVRQSPRRVAVADGVSNAWRSGAWAKTLVWQFVRPSSAVFDDFPAWLAGVQGAWSHRPADLSRVPAFARPKVHRGAFATLLGLELTVDGNRALAYRAFALGDSCLLHVRDGALLHGFPLASADAFGSAPMTLPSNAHYAENVVPHARCLEETLAPGDRLLLATDALACHLLAMAANDPDWWLRLEPVLRDPPALRTHVMTERAGHRLADDDTTALLLCIDA